MRKFTKLVLVAGLSTGLVGGLTATPAFAKGSKAKFCKAVTNLGDDVTQQPTDGTTIPTETAADLERNFKKLAKAAPNGKLKSAVKDIAAYYGQIADGDSVEDISQEDAEAYGEGFATFSQYFATKCISELVPDITLPGGGQVSIPGA